MQKYIKKKKIAHEYETGPCGDDQHQHHHMYIIYISKNLSLDWRSVLAFFCVQYSWGTQKKRKTELICVTV